MKMLGPDLDDAVEVEAHGQLRDVAHEVIQPIVQASQDRDGSPHVPVSQSQQQSHVAHRERAH